jgi:hypothetical protein
MKNCTLPLRDGAFYIDASTLEGHYMQCPRDYQLYGIYRRELDRAPHGLTFGKFVHEELLAPHYSGVHVDIEEALTRFPDSLREDYRNAGYAKELWKIYCDTYPSEPFDVLRVNGVPVVEKAFDLEIGQMYLSQIEHMVPVHWIGKIDAVVQWPNDEISHIDHKTKSIGGESAWDEFVNSTQQLGYTWAVQKLFGSAANSFAINMILTRRLTATGKGIECVRQRFPVDQDVIDEFPSRIMNVVWRLFRDSESQMFPMHTSSCVRKYGKCDFLQVCRLAPSLREDMISTNIFRDVTWSPLDE